MVKLSSPKIQQLDGLWSRWKRASATIRFRMLGLVAFSVLMPSLIGGWLAIGYLDSVIRNQVFEDLGIRTERIADEVSRWINNRSLDVRAFTSTHILIQEVNSVTSAADPDRVARAQKTISGYLSYLLEDNSLFSGFLILDPDGKAVASQPEGLNFRYSGDPLKLNSTQPLIMELSDGDKSNILVVQAMGGTGTGLKPLFVSFLGTENLLNTLRGGASADATVYIMDDRGRLKGFIGQGKRGQEVPEDAFTFLRPGGKPFLYRGLSGEKVLGTGSPIGHLDWTVVLEIPATRAFAPLRNVRWILLLVTLVLAVLLFIPAMILARTISQPLDELSQVSRVIRGGGAGAVVKADTGGELGELVATFNSMSMSMKDSMDEINLINDQLRMMSVTDPLTGLFNRRYSEEHLNREIKLVRRTGESLSLLMMDIDHFKDYNDNYGHIAGDEALKQISEVILANVRDTDIVARYGGEEFVVIMTHTAREGARNAAQKLRRAIEENIFRLKGIDTRITVSIGVATAPLNGDIGEEILDAADTALYAAKQAGRNRVRSASKRRRSGSTPRDGRKPQPGSSSPAS